MKHQKKQDLDDYNNEIAGRDTGRIKRFLSKEAREYLEDGKDNKSTEKLSLLDILLMTGPVYSQLYSDVMEKIEDIDRAVNKALFLANQRIDNLETNLADIKNRAQRLDDGTLIYRSQDGSVYTDDGIAVSQRELGDVRWKATDPSWEERCEAGKNLDTAYKEKEEIEEYRDGTLQDVKNRMKDRDNPPDKDELQSLYDDLEELPNSVEANMSKTPETSTQSNFMDAFNSKASGQNETKDTDLSQNQPIPQEAVPAQTPSGAAP